MHQKTGWIMGIAISALFWQMTAIADVDTPVVTVGAPTPTITAGGPVTFPVTYTDAGGSGLVGITLSTADITLNRTGTATGALSVGDTRNVIGTDNWLEALAVDTSGNVYAGGYFRRAGGVPALGIAKWNGTTWSALGSGANDWVYALAADGSGNLYAGGRFMTIGGISANGIAKWNGTAWSALGTGMGDPEAPPLSTPLRRTLPETCMPGVFL